PSVDIEHRRVGGIPVARVQPGIGEDIVQVPPENGLFAEGRRAQEGGVDGNHGQLSRNDRQTGSRHGSKKRPKVRGYPITVLLDAHNTPFRPAPRPDCDSPFYKGHPTVKNRVGTVELQSVVDVGQTTLRAPRPMWRGSGVRGFFSGEVVTN